ncbi:MAG: PQQ-binding-like beta-propeller repeat protein [Pirellulales bacterium]|nr:PQQ-binding-like beta-propeller repeat protein [Pirellulales bacterium]
MMDVGSNHSCCVVLLVVSSWLLGWFFLPVDGRAASLTPPPGVLLLAQSEAASDEKKEDASPETSVFPRPERTLLRQLSNARELIERRRYGEAVRCLGAILESPEDCFYQPRADEPLHRSLRSEANRILGSMASRGRELYELQYGAQARHLLEEAVAARSRDLLDEVSRRFYHTRAGYEATFLLGLYDLDHREPLGAALTLRELRDEATSIDRFEPALSLSLATCWYQAEYPEKAKQTLRDLRDRYPAKLVAIAGREQVLSRDDEDLFGWFVAQVGSPWSTPDARWLRGARLGGNASHGAAAAGGKPLLEPIWEVPISDHPDAGSLLASQCQYQAERNVAMVPSAYPLALDEIVLMRSLRTLLAIDSKTGKRLWEIPTDDVLDSGRDAYRALFPQQGQFGGLLCERVWMDGLYGSLSSDGQRVFSVEDLSIGVGSQGRRSVVQGGRRVMNPVWPKAFNRLAAYDLSSGKLVWHLGGSGGDWKLPLPGAFFLGAPLPMANRLYQLAEIRGEIRLLALQASSGDVLWSQRIALAERSILQDSTRRLTGSTPSYRNGVMVCPTASGAIVAVKLAKRSLLWGYSYARNEDSRRTSMRFTSYSGGGSAPNQWIDGSVVLLEDRVLTTPTDSDEIHCLSLSDGRPVWKRPRDGDLCLAAVRDGTAVLVGSRRIRALSVATGQPAWDGRTVDLPDGDLPSGRGFQAGRLYYLPLNSAKVLVVDLEAGKIDQTLVSRSGTVAGNLVCCRDKIISQSIQGVTAFHQLDALRDQIAQRLADNADDPKALRLKGEVLLNAGRRGEAIDCFRRAYRAAPGKKCRSQLRDALFDGLRHEFASYRSAGAEIEGLLETPAERIEYYRLMALGFESRPDPKAAMEYYLRLADSCRHGYELIRIDPSHSVRQDRWLCTRLSVFRESAPAETIEQFDREVDQRLAAALEDEKTGSLSWFVHCFGSQPQAAKAEGELVDRHLAANQLLKAEMVLRRRMRSSTPAQAAAIMFRLAKILEKANRWDEAAACYREIEEKYADVVCHEGKTGRQLVASLPAHSAILARLHPERIWPVGAVESTAARTEPETSNQSVRRTSPVEFHGDRGPFFAHREGAVDQSRHELYVFDGFGREEWKVRIEDHDQPYLFFHPRVGCLSARGHLLLLSLGYRCIAIDTLAAGGPRVLWDQSMIDSVETAGDGGVGVQAFNAQWGPRVFFNSISRSTDQWDSYAPDAFCEDYYCYRKFRRCTAVDPLSGETLWTRRHLPPKCIVFGDSRRVFLVEVGKTEATVLRASDGERLPETRVVPPRQEWIATLGCNILQRRARDGGRHRVELFDPWKQKTLWKSETFAAKAKMCCVNHDAVGVMEPDGRFVMFALPSGEKRIDVRLAPEPDLEDMVLLDSGSGYILVTNTQAKPKSTRGMIRRQLSGVTSKAIGKGRVHAFDRSGKRLWPDRPKGVEIENQQLPLAQPAWLPVLTFASQTYTHGIRGTQRSTSLLMIDKRTGREVVNKEFSDQPIRCELTGNPETRSVEFAMKDKVVRLTFTDKPVAPGGKTTRPADGRRGTEKPKTWDAILKALKGVSGG